MGDLGIAAEQEDIEISGGCVALTDLKQKAGHIAHHVLEERGRLGVDEDEGRLRRVDLEAMDRAP